MMYFALIVVSLLGIMLGWELRAGAAERQYAKFTILLNKEIKKAYRKGVNDCAETASRAGINIKVHDSMEAYKEYETNKAKEAPKGLRLVKDDKETT